MGTLLTRNYKYRTAKQFMELFSSNSHRVYAVIGNDSASQTASDPTESLSSDFSFWDELKGVKRITSSDVSMVVPYGTGTSLVEIENGISFSEYDHALDLFGIPTKFLGYTVEDDRSTGRVRIWKCLFNNSGGNVAEDEIPEPADDTNVGIVTNTGSGEDGYHWKYMYSFRQNSIFFSEDINFKWMPVKSLSLKPSDSELLKQWNVQMAAVDGSVDSITHSSTFSGFTNGSAVTLTGGNNDFAGTIATLGAKQYVNITNGGTGYRSVSAIDVVGATSSEESALSAKISPISGHGFDAERELGAKDLMVTSQITDSDLDADTDIPRYATVALILDPIVSGSSQDDITTSGTSISSGSRTSGTSYLQAGLLKYSGQILYVDQRATITRNASNTDTIRLVIQF